MLQLADFFQEFVVVSDSSEIAAGSCLLQQNDKNDLLPLCYYSKKYTDAKLKYSVYEKEAYNLILCIEKWHKFLEVRPFKGSLII